MIVYNHLMTHGITMKEYREKFPEAPLWSEESLQKLRVPHIGSGPSGPTPTSFKKGDPRITGERNFNYGGLSKEHKEKVRQGVLKRYREDPTYRLRVSKGTKVGMQKTNKHIGRKRGFHSHRKGLTLEEEYGKEKAKEMRKNYSKIAKKLWENDEYAEKNIRSTRSANGCRPSKTEQIIMDILNELFPQKFRYNGYSNQGIIINRKVPDFVYENGKKAIEVFGDYWHRGEDPQDRIEAFADHGWDCLVIWEHELNETSLIDKINQFFEGGKI